ncbi:hypothetical protein V3G39_12045 [Dermatophilaceae bacterium Sec6.4]
MVTNNNDGAGGARPFDESVAEDGDRSQPGTPWRQGRDADPTTGTPEEERIRDTRNERVEVDRRGSDRVVAADDERVLVDPEAVTQVQKDRHGGVKVGSAFFGWLTATGMAVLLTALLAAAGAAVGVGSNDITKAADGGTSSSNTVGIVGAIVLLVIVLVSYYCGGYVAGRMARFNGISQGVAVWVWTLVIAVVLAVLAAAAGQKYNVSATLNIFPRIPVREGTLTTAGIIALLVVAVAALIGAILGGLAGMRYHRRVDHTVPIA